MVTHWVWRLGAMFVLATSMGCTGPTEPVSSGEVELGTIRSETGGDFNLHTRPALTGADVVQRVQRSFLAVAGEHRGGAATWTSRVTAAGEIGFVARHGVEAQPLRMRSSVARAGEAHDDGALIAAPRVDTDGTLVLTRRTHTERLQANVEGLEQSWSFDARPPGTGDLIVRVHTSGQRFRGITASGAHFVDDGTTLGTRYGHATWIDARGERTRVGARFDSEQSAILLTVPEALIDGSAYPALLDPIVSAEKELDAPILGGQIGEQTHPGIAYGAGIFLIAWKDQRFDSEGDVIAARVTPAGTLLDPGGVPVAMSFGKDRAPAVAFDGTKFLVAYESEEYDPVYPDIYARAVDSSGGLGSLHWLETGNHSERLNPAVAFDGVNYLIAWQDRRPAVPDSIEVTKLSKAGVWSLIATPIPGAGGQQQLPSVAYGGSNFLVAWQDFRSGSNWDVFGARVSKLGSVLDNAGGIAISAKPHDELAPALASDNAMFLATWADTRNGNSDIYSTRINASGIVQNPLGTPVTTAPGRQTEPAVAWSGTRYLAAWHDERNNLAGDIYATTLLATGAVLFPGGIAVSTAQGEQSRVTVAAGQNCFRVAWDDLRTPSWRKIWSSCVSDLGVVDSPTGVFVGAAANNEVRPAMARGISSQLAVWADDRNGAWDIYGVRLDDSATPIGAAFPIATGTSNSQFPAVSFNGTHWVVVWQDDRNGVNDIYGARVSQAGNVLDPAGVALVTAAGAQTDPHIAWNGSQHYVVWSDTRNKNSDIYGTRVTTTLGALDAGGVALATGAALQNEPAIAALGGRYLVAWTTGEYPAAKIRGVRVSGAGTKTLPEILVTQAHADFREADIDADRQNFMVVTRRDGTFIDVVRVTTGATVLDTPPVWTGMGGSSEPAIRFDNTRFLVAAMRHPFQIDTTDVAVIRVSTAAVPLEAGPFVATNTLDDECFPALVAIDSNQWAIVYQRKLLEDLGAWRARARVVTY